MELRKTKYLQYAVNTLLIMTAVVLLMVVLWGLDKGFDLTDEAYYLLGLMPAQEKLSTFTALQFTIFSKVLGWIEGIISFRILSLVMILLSAPIFSWGFLKISRRLYPDLSILSPAAITAGFVGTSFFIIPALTLTFSYNVFIQVWMLLTGGLVLYSFSIADQADHQRRLQWIWLGIGALLMVAAWIKPTSALALTLLYWVAAFFFMLPRWKAYGLGVLLPFLSGGLLMLGVLYFPMDAIRPILVTLDASILHPGHQPLELLLALQNDVLNVASSVWRSKVVLIGLVLGLLVAWPKWPKKFYRWFPWGIGAGQIGLLVFSYPMLQDAFTKERFRLPALYVFVAILLMLIGLIGPTLLTRFHLTIRPRWGWERKEVQKIWVWLVLAFLPLGAAFGTNNTLVWQLWIHITPWFGLLLLLFMETQMTRWIWPMGWLTLVFIVSWVWGQWMSIYFFKPYRLAQDRLSQVEALNVRSSRVRGLKVDPQSKFFLEKVDTILAESDFKPGMGVIALYDMPGLVYLSDGFSPGDPWYQRDETRVELLIGQMVNSKMPDKSALILTNRTVAPELLETLGHPEFDFPNAYWAPIKIPYINRQSEFILYIRRR